MNRLLILFAGEQIIFLLVGVFVGAIPIVIGLIVYYLLRSQKQQRASWESAATMLGLSIAPAPKLELTGRFGDYNVAVLAAIRRSGDSTQSFTCCRCPLRRRLRWLLQLSAPQNMIAQLFDGGADVVIGNDEFDRKYKAACYDPDILRRLLLSDFPTAETRNLAEDLILVQRAFPIVKITDDEIYLETGGHLANTAQIRSLIEATTRLASRFDAARALFPPAAWEAKLIADWSSYASRNKLNFDAERISIEGRMGAFEVKIATETGKGRWQTAVTATFPRELPGGLRVMTETALHSALEWLGAQDIATGQREFDELFIVKAADAGYAVRVLRPELCQHLVEMRRTFGEVTISPTTVGVVVDRLIGDAAELQKTVGAVVSVAAALPVR